MVEPSRRAPLRGPTFIRLIARLADIDVAHPEASLSDRLSQWIDWTRAVALSRALDPATPAAAAGQPTDSDEDMAECARTRASLMAGIATESQALGDAGGMESATMRKRYLAQQRTMQAATGRLRGRLRDRLASRSADMARLAEVDAVMEMVLSPREHALLASVPDLLSAHLDRLRPPAAEAASANDAAPPADDAWLGVFRRDMHNVLLAELDVRFQPIEGLLAALNPQRQWTS